MIVSTHGLTKQYGTFTALDHCNTEVANQEVFGLLGPNGAGKTTLLRLLLGFLQPTDGRAQIGGFDCSSQSIQVRQRVAYLPGEARLYRRMKGADVLQFFAQMRPGGNLAKSRRLAQHLDLDLRRRVASMSTGMRQKLAITITLAHEAEVYILDEPTANLDPNVRRSVMEMVREKRQEGHSVLISSHVLSEMEESCDRVVILRHGKLVHTQVMSQLRQRHQIYATANGPLAPVPQHLVDRIQLTVQGQQVQIDTQGDLADLMGWIAGQPLTELSVQRCGLSTIYEQYHSAEAAL